MNHIAASTWIFSGHMCEVAVSGVTTFSFVSKSVLLFISFPCMGHRFTYNLKWIMRNQSAENVDTTSYMMQAQLINCSCTVDFLHSHCHTRKIFIFFSFAGTQKSPLVCFKSEIYGFLSGTLNKFVLSAVEPRVQIIHQK